MLWLEFKEALKDISIEIDEKLSDCDLELVIKELNEGKGYDIRLINKKTRKKEPFYWQGYNKDNAYSFLLGLETGISLLKERCKTK